VTDAGNSPGIRDLTDEEARAALPQKWGSVGPGVIPAYVAEMDFAPAPVVRDALLDAVRRGVTGYPPNGDGGVGAVFAGFAARHWDWAPPDDAAVVTGDVIGGIRLAFDVLCPPGPVVVPMPCYPPFREVIALAGRELVGVETDPDAASANLDLDALDTAFAAGARTLLLCSPHNPLGRVWTRGELEDLRDLTSRHGVRVVVDEIHGPLVLPGATFTPYLSVDPTAILVTSPSKAFNTPGLHCALVITLDPADQQLLRGVPLAMNNLYSPLGMVAATAAYGDGDEWVAALVVRLDEQRTLLGKLLAERLPEARMRPLEATYLPWLDLRAYGVDDLSEPALAQGLKLAPGQSFQPGLPGHARLNLATSPERLTAIVDRLGAAVGARTP
jgi:cystathionine beta-lyase